MSTIDEKQLIQKASKGNGAAFEQLMLKYQGQIYNLCFRMLGNSEDAADMTQETFLKAWKHLDGFQFESSLSTWLYRLASNSCLDLLRSQKRHPTISLVSQDEDGEEQTLDPMDSEPLPEDQIIWNEEQRQISQAMASLDVEQRQILTLRVVNDLSYSQIADILSIKEGTVKSRIARARENLRKKVLQIRNKTASSASKATGGGKE